MTATITSPTSPAGATAPAALDIDIKCAGLTKVFRDFWLRNRVRAVDGVDLEIRRGEIFGLCGPNGSGKSTTIKLLLGLLKPTAGKIAIFGHHPTHVATKKLVGYLPEESYLYPFQNARETLDYYGRLFYQNRQQRRNRIDMLLDMVGLGSVQRRPIGEYSKGMQRRVGFAQALINDPQLLILDEPTSGMDPMGTRMIKDLIIQLGRKGKTILLCSHRMDDVEDVCNRVAIMFGGKVRREGTCDELLVQEGQTMLQTPVLSDEVVQEIESVLRRHGQAIEKIDHPRQRFEAFFLDVIHDAQAKGVHTSGAESGGRLAEFLVGGGAEESGSSTEQVIDDLLTADTPASAEAEPVVTAPAPAVPDVAEQVLGELMGTQSAEADAPVADTTGAAPVGTADSDSQTVAIEGADVSVIDSLLGADEPQPDADADAAELADGVFAQNIDIEMGDAPESSLSQDQADVSTDEEPDQSLRSSIDSLLDESDRERK